MDWKLGKKLARSKKEREECLQTLDAVLNLVEKAKKNGIWCLEEDIEFETDLFNRHALMLLVDEIEYDTVKHALETRMLTSNLSGKQLLKRMLYTEAVLLLKRNNSRRVIREVLFSYFGEELLEFLTDKYDCSAEKMQSRADKYFDDAKKRKPMSIATSLLEEPVSRLSNKELKQALSSVDKKDLIYALKGVSGETEKQILYTKSFSARVFYIDELTHLGRVSIDEITRAQDVVLSALRDVIK